MFVELQIKIFVSTNTKMLHYLILKLLMAIIHNQLKDEVVLVNHLFSGHYKPY